MLGAFLRRMGRLCGEVRGEWLLCVCVGLSGVVLTVSRSPTFAGKGDPPPVVPVSPDAEAVWPTASEWKPGDNRGFPERVPAAVSEGLPTSKAPQFVTTGSGVLPSVDDGQIDVGVGPVGERADGVGVEHGAPMRVAPVAAESKSDLAVKGFRSPDSVTVSVIGTKSAEAAGLGIFGFSLTDSSATAAANGETGPTVVQVSLDYSDFRYAYGGDWAERLQLWKYPACVLSSPEKFECSEREAVEIFNDSAAAVITADVEVDVAERADPKAGTAGDVASDVGLSGGDAKVPSTDPVAESTPVKGQAGSRRVTHSLPQNWVAATGAGGSVYGWTAGYSSNAGSYAATPLSASSSWTVGLGMGSFNYSYPVPVPPTGFGAAPSVGFNYSSTGVDGVTADENNQGLMGPGWDLGSGGFIERTYQPCAVDAPIPTYTYGDDLCWVSDNATINLNGHSSELVPIGTPAPLSTTTPTTSEWRLKDDPGWKVQRDSLYQPWAYDTFGERWRVWSPDGTEYTFGLRQEWPGGGPSEETESVLFAPVFGNNPGEPCQGWCNQAWRWYLDRVTNRDGNIITYKYKAELNYYQLGGVSNTSAAMYARGAYLAEIHYGTDVAHPADFRNVIKFNMQNRCRSTDPAVCFSAGPNATATATWIDVPTDLLCPASQPFPGCTKRAPSFFTMQGLVSIDTKVKENEVLADGGLEAGGIGVGYLPPAGGGVTNYAIYNNPPAAHVGSRYLETNTSGANGSVYLDGAISAVTAGSTATVTAWVRTPAPGTTATASLVLWGLGGYDENAGQSFTADNTWRQVSATLPITSSAHTAMRAQVYLSTVGVNLDIDSISVRASKWRTVDTITPTFDWPSDPANYVATQLWLRTIGRTGAPGTTVEVVIPNIGFESSQVLDNRADTVTRKMWRISQINDEIGGRTTVGYAQMFPCPEQDNWQPAGGWANNTQDCFPRWSSETNHTGFKAYNRWLVMTVTSTDLVASSLPVSHTYSYEGTPMYHHEDSPYVPLFLRTWSQPRGYGQVLELVGDFWAVPSKPVSMTRHWFFRGMNGDLNSSGGAKTVTVTYNDGVGSVIVDHPPLQGLEYATASYMDVVGAPFEHDIRYYGTVETAAATLPNPLKANRVITYQTNHWSSNGAGTFATETRTEFDSSGYPELVWDRGDTSTNTDDTCTALFWARNYPLNLTNLIGLQTRVYKAAGAPLTSSTQDHRTCNPSAELGVSETFYDGYTNYGVSTAAGRVTSTRTRAGSASPWATTGFGYDTNGRVTAVDGPLPGTTDSTITGYDTYGYAKSVTDPTGHKTITLTDPGRGSALWVNDLNIDATGSLDGWLDDKPTAYTYDGVGRVLAVFTPDGGQKEAEFTYSVTKIAPSSVKTSVEQSTGVWVSSWSYLDGLGRTRETQTVSPNQATKNTNRLVSATQYDERSLPTATFANLDASGVAGSGMLWPNNASFPSTFVMSETRTAFDNLSRPVSTKLFTNNVQATSVYGVAIQTIYTYTGHQTTVSPPEGAPSVSRMSDTQRSAQDVAQVLLGVGEHLRHRDVAPQLLAQRGDTSVCDAARHDHLGP